MITFGFILLWIAIMGAVFMGYKLPTIWHHVRANKADALYTFMWCAGGFAFVVCIVCFGAFLIYSAGKADALAPYPSGSGTSSATSLLAA